MEIESRPGSHILDHNNRQETFDILYPILVSWQWARPRPPEALKGRLSVAFENITDDYDEIRQSSMFDAEIFQESHEKHLALKRIWNELGVVKVGNETSRELMRYLIMPITKVLMFLWGQTPAFDKYVRENMNESSQLASIVSSRDYWTFNEWIVTLKVIKDKTTDSLKAMFDETALEEYNVAPRRGYLIPYGQFIDCCFWVYDKENN
ncbi:MAG: hypothetical protein ACTSXP_01695 [Promethearchaeota archaeon]